MTRKAFLRLSALDTAAFLAETPAVLEAESKPIRVGFILPNYDQIRWKSGDQPCFESEAQTLGLKTFIVTSQQSETVQASQVENMLTQGVDAIVLRPVNAAASTSLVRNCKQAGVPLIAYDSLPLKADAACFIGRDAIEMGKSIAEVAVRAQPKGNYILALGDEGVNVAREEKRGYHAVLKPYLGSGAIKIVSEQFNMIWSTNSACAQVENPLTKNNNDVAAVICGNDGTAYGANSGAGSAGAGRQGVGQRGGRRTAGDGADPRRADSGLQLHRLLAGRGGVGEGGGNADQGWQDRHWSRCR